MRIERLLAAARGGFLLLKTKKAWVGFPILFLLSGLLTGCFVEPKFPNEPVIHFKEIRKFVIKDELGNAGVDSVVVSVSFQDGDGDLGLTQDELTSKPYDTLKNYIVTTWVLRNGEYEKLKDFLGHDVNNSGNFPPLLPPNSKPSPIEGTLDYSIKFYPGLSTKKDTVRFDIQIMDRRLHKSSPVTTEPIVVNGL